ncbi:2-amino-4-hydroxy-6-hydroxymethyldihydropteridine diphosphokinase [Balneatrix alpica]|uniref:2-amino-4-hydroxy-6- hydroxymethyldihydropteridine diphosphokinase n=1 Tax=Balneatrix alpica TaxID=75684 RepID=UPI002739D93B|nr:2-amino-4-hydroxy-6-hydroxymethyldihydropteridine diphosphokinase [Balneatrix alpica]
MTTTFHPEGQLAWIGLGSNLEDPKGQIRQALHELASLPQSQLLGHSGLYLSAPLGPQDQPDFVNAVALLRTHLAPLNLLDELQQLEQQHHRVRIQHWGPRTLDLDLLLYGQEVIDHPRLQVPHPHLHRRNFVLYPLMELSPGLSVPGFGPLIELLADCPLGTLSRLAV